MAGLKSKSQSLRDRLREKESRLLSIIHKGPPCEKIELDCEGSGTESSTSAETTALISSIVNNANNNDTNVNVVIHKDLKAHINEPFCKHLHRLRLLLQKKKEMIRSLEIEAAQRNAALDVLKHELVCKLRRIVELEVELDSHSLHFTSYQSDMINLRSEIMKGIDNGTIDSKTLKLSQSNNESESDKESEEAKERAKKFLMLMIQEVDTYKWKLKNERVKNMVSKEEMRLKNEELKTKLMVSESDRPIPSDDGKSNSTDPTEDVCSIDSITDDGEEEDEVFFLRRQVEILNANRALYRDEIDQLREEMEQSKMESEMDKCALEAEVERICLERDVAIERLHVLERAGGGECKSEGSHVLDSIENRIESLSSELKRLRSSCVIKDKKIDSLTRENVKLQCKNILEGAVGDTEYTLLDTELFRSKDVYGYDLVENILKTSSLKEVGQSIGSQGAAWDLYSQLETCKEKLQKKEEELNSERFKCQSLAAAINNFNSLATNDNSTNGNSNTNKKKSTNPNGWGSIWKKRSGGSTRAKI